MSTPEVAGPQLLVHLWTTSGEAVGVVVGLSTSVTFRHNGIDTASVQVAVDDPLATALAAVDGVNLAVIEFRGVRFTGWAVAVAGDSDSVYDERSGRVRPNGTLTVTLVGDWSLLAAMVAVPVPTSPIDAQTASPSDNRTGSLELVVKGVVADNAARLGLPLAVMPVRNGGLGDGPTVTVSPRMTPMLDVLRPVLDGVNWRVATRTWLPGDQQPHPSMHLDRPTVVVDVVATGSGETLQWSTASAAVTKWTVERSSAQHDASIVGGAGEGTARTFVEVVDDARRAVGGGWRRAETFVDARDVQGNDTMPQLWQRGQESNADGAPTGQVSLEVLDGMPWTFGDAGDETYREGDVATVDVFGVPFTDRITAVTVTETTDLTVTPLVGNSNQSASTDPVLLDAIRRLQTSIAKRAAI